MIFFQIVLLSFLHLIRPQFPCNQQQCFLLTSPPPEERLKPFSDTAVNFQQSDSTLGSSISDNYLQFTKFMLSPPPQEISAQRSEQERGKNAEETIPQAQKRSSGEDDQHKDDEVLVGKGQARKKIYQVGATFGPPPHE